jgi:hypothetical protein
MKPDNIQTFKSPRWIALYISLAMMVFGWFAGHGFDYLSRRFPPIGPRNLFDGTFFPEAVVCVMLFFAGMILCVICCLWILVAAAISASHKKHSP